MQLQDLQAEFKDALFSEDNELECVIPSSHLQIYKDNIIVILAQSLKSYYPLIYKLIGDNAFNHLAREYIKHYPSRSSNLHDYGEYLSDFIQSLPYLDNYPYLPEVAKFEWACHTIYFAADAEQFHLDHNNYLEMYGTLHPASRLISFNYPILDIIDLCQGQTEDNIDIHKGGVNLLIIRRDLDIKLAPLSQADHVFLTNIQANNTFEHAKAEAQVIDSNYDLNKKLTAFLENKTIIDIFD